MTIGLQRMQPLAFVAIERNTHTPIHINRGVPRMLVTTLADVEAAGRLKSQRDGAILSARYLTAAHGMGFSLHLNRSAKVPPVPLWYKNHWEANYILTGEAEIVDLDTANTLNLGPGEAYQVGPKDRHTFGVPREASHISVFCPPLKGDEVHDEDGAYAANGPVPPNDGRIFVRKVEELLSQGRELTVAHGKVRTIRMITAADEMGFSLSDVRLDAGAAADLWYKHHLEANYIAAGSGRVEDLNTAEAWDLGPDTLYCVGPEDRHRLSAETDLHILSVFCPPLRGDEQHDADGSYGPGGPVPPGPGV
jgi:L-ectoine synthase